MNNVHVNCSCGAKYMRKRGECPECGGSGDPIMAELRRQTELLEEIAEAFRPPEPIDETQYTCRCTLKNGGPISNCPVCKGTGQA